MPTNGFYICLLVCIVHLPLAYFCLPASGLTTNDIVDRREESRETALSPMDFLSAPDKEVDLRELGIDVADDPTLGNKTEGDIAIPNIKKFMDQQTSGLARNSIRQQYSKSNERVSRRFLTVSTKTCIRFVARDSRRHADYVYIHPDDGCYSLVGRVGGRQPLSLDSGCIQVGTIVHELMHSVGFFHEQSRYDRDAYIDILWPNVVNGADDQFEKYGVSVINQLNEPHYGPYAFSQNGRKTIVPRRAGAQKMGQRIQFSDIDLRKINKLYNCGMASGMTTNSVVEQQMHGQVAPQEANCEDINWRCTFWSLRVFNYCDIADIRDKICPYSCGTCDSPSVQTSQQQQNDCMDGSIICQEISQNSCQMPMTSKICRRTCKNCYSSV